MTQDLFDPRLIFEGSKAPKPAPGPKNAVEVFDKATGTTQWLDPADAEAQFKAGKVNLPNFKPVSVQNADGSVAGVDPTKISESLNAGATLISDEDRHAEELHHEYRGGKGMAIAGAAGVGRGLTLGTSDALLPDDWKEAVEASNELHPIARTAGEVGGMALGSAIVPGAGLGSAAEELAGGALARATGGAITKEAAGLGARALARGAAMGARGAVEGTTFGLQNVLSEAALSKEPPDLTGEKIVAGLGTGALYGALGGAAAGAGTEALATGLRRGAEKLAPYLETQANREAWRDINSSAAITKQTMRRVPGGVEALGKVARDEGLMDPRLTVEEQFARAGEAKERVGQEIGDMYRQSGAMGKPKDLLDRLDGLIDDVRKDAGRENVVRSLETYKSSLAEKLYAGAVGAEAKASPQELQLAAAEKQMLARGAGDAELAELRQIRESLREARLAASQEQISKSIANHEVPLEELWNQRRALGKLVYAENKALDPNMRVELLRQFYGAFGDYLSTAGEEAASASGKEFAAPLGALNKRYQALALINDSLEVKVARSLTNRRASLTDSIMQSGGNAAGMTALMSGHPLVAAGALASGATNKFLRERGPRVASWILGQVSGFEDVAAHVAGVDTAIERAVTDFVDREPPRVSGVFPRAEPASAPAEEASKQARVEDERLEDRFASRAGKVRELAAHPDLAGTASAQLASVSQHSPEAVSHAASTISRAVQFLASRLPPAPALDPLRPELQTMASRAEMDRWLREERAVDRPESLVEDLRGGKVDPVAVNAVQKVYPALYAQVRSQMLSRLAETSRPITRQERLQLGEAFGIPATLSLTPENIAARQAAFAPAKPSGSAGPASRRRSGKLAESFGLASAAQRLEKGED